MSVQELQERDRLLSAQNEMLKRDKTNLKKRVSELEVMVKTILETPSTWHLSQQASTSKKSAVKLHDGDFTRRLEQSEKHLSRVNGELAQYFKSGGGQPRDKRDNSPQPRK